MEKLIKQWKFDLTIYQDEFKMGTFSHNLSLFAEPIDENSYPVQMFTIIWEIPAFGESIKAQISTIDMVIHDHRNLFAIRADILEYIYSFGFCLDNSLDPDCIFINQNYEYDEQA